MDNPTTMRYIESLGGVLYSANNLVRDLEPENEMQNIRISAEKDCSTQGNSNQQIQFFALYVSRLRITSELTLKRLVT